MKIGTDFSGIGSPEMALKLLNIEHEQVFACEIDKYARKSFEAIHGKPKTFYKDITKREHSEIPQLDLYVAGFPCQAFSNEGMRKGFEDIRGTLFFNVAQFIKTNQPKCFILENVKGLLSHDEGKTFQTIISLLTDNGGTANGQIFIPYFEDGLGYHVYYKVLNTKDYGIPQNRERIFIVGFKEFRQFSFPKPFALELTLKDMLQKNPNNKYFLNESTLQSIIYKENESIQDPDKSFVKIKSSTKCGYEVASNGDSIDLQYKNSKTRRGKVKKGIAQTLITLDLQAVLINDKIRKLTPLECFRLQGFPDDAFFRAEKVNSDTQLYKQAGNSITTCVMVELFKKILCLE